MADVQNEVMPRELTFGEKAVGLTFNPSQDEGVKKVKELFAAVIDFCNDRKDAYDGKPNEKNRMFAIAITEAQTAQMWAVKALTWKE